MRLPHLLAASLLVVASVSAFADTQNVQDFRVRYRAQPNQAAVPEAMRGVQRVADLQSTIGGGPLTHRRTLQDGTHEMRTSKLMTRAEAWAMAEKIMRDNPSVGSVEPVDPEADLVPGRAPGKAR